MTEDKIERIAERRMDSLDRRYLAGEISPAEYHAGVKDLDAWAIGKARRAEIEAAINARYGWPE